VNDESVSRQIRNLTKVNLAGAKIIASWRDKKTQIVYSIAELDMKQVKGTVGATQEMNDNVRRYVESNADNIFDKVSKEKN
ncbi:MAG: hypothetical protein AAB134_00395, partial [Pseudomonadota bacterium]